MDDFKVAQRLRSHDEQMFQKVIDQYSKLLWVVVGGVLTANCGNPQDLEECVSDIFIALWENPASYDPERGSLKSYLCMMAKSRALNRVKKNNREKVVSLEDHLETEQGEEPQYLFEQDYSRLYEAIRELPEPTREILVRRYFYEQKPAEIAKRLELPKKEIENRLYRAKKSLSSQLADMREVL